MSLLNNKKRILITGASGLLGYFWINKMFNEFDIILVINQREINYKNLKSVRIDLFNFDDIVKQIKKQNISIVINLAGISNVEKCEECPELAFSVNQKLAKIVAKACNFTNTKLIHISTDHLFGDQRKLNTESDEPLLVNNYAKSKYLGECEVLKENPQTLVCRTNFFGRGPKHRISFSDWIIEGLTNKKTMNLFDDVYFSPIIGYKVPEYAHRLLDLGASGIYNLSSDDVISKYKFGEYIAQIFDLPKRLIKKSFIDNRKDLTNRPLCMGLSNKKASRILNQPFGKVIDHIALLYEQAESKI